MKRERNPQNKRSVSYMRAKAGWTLPVAQTTAVSCYSFSPVSGNIHALTHIHALMSAAPSSSFWWPLSSGSTQFPISVVFFQVGLFDFLLCTVCLLESWSVLKHKTAPGGSSHMVFMFFLSGFLSRISCRLKNVSC